MIALPSSASTSPYLSSGGACADHVLSRCSCGDALPVACLLREVLRLWGGGPASVDFNHVPCVLLWPLAERRDRLFAILVPESWTCALIDRRAVNCNKALLPQSPSWEAPVVKWFKHSLLTTSVSGSGFISRLGTLSACDTY